MASSQPPKIIGIAGTNGSGKDTVGGLLAKQHNFLFISVTDLLREELKIRGLPPARDHMRDLSAEWRRQSGLGVLVEKAKEIFDSKSGEYEGLAMASLRNPGEADTVHGYGGVMIWVDGDPLVRYKRIQDNAANRGNTRSVDDNKSFEEFMADEQAEMEHPAGGDNATLSMSEVKSRCDVFLTNDGNDLNLLSNQLDKALGF